MESRLTRPGMRAIALILGLLLLSLSTVYAVVQRDVDYTEDFTNSRYTEGGLIDNARLPIHQFWTVQQFANYAVAPCSEFVKDGDAMALHFQGFSGMLSTSTMFDSYTYSVTMRMPKGVTGGVGVTARHSTGSKIGPLYEADMFREHGGNGNYDIEGFRHDYSGIAVYPTATTDHTGSYRVMIGIKTFEDNGKHRVANRYYEVYTTTNLTEYFTLDFVDKNQTLTIKLNGQVLCSVEMSNPGTFADPADHAEYYRTAVVKDSAGDTVLELDNAKLAVNARLAITNRNSQCYIKAIKAFSDNLENGTIPPETEAPATSAGTAAPGTETDAQATEPTKQDGEGLTLSTDLVLLIALGAVQVVLVGAIAVVVFGKKKQ